MITDADVKKLEKTFITINGLKKELNLFATKKDLVETENKLNKRIDRLSKEIDFKLEPLMEFKEEFSGFKSSVLKTLDWLVGAFTKFNEDHTVLTEQNGRAHKKLDNHENRIISLEQRVVTV